MNNDLQFASGAAGQVKVGDVIGQRKARLHILNLIHVLAGEIDADFAVIGTHDQDLAGAHMQAQRSIGGTLKFHMRFARKDDLGFGIREQHRGRQGDQGKHWDGPFHRHTSPHLLGNTMADREMFPDFLAVWTRETGERQWAGWSKGPLFRLYSVKYLTAPQPVPHAGGEVTHPCRRRPAFPARLPQPRSPPSRHRGWLLGTAPRWI